MKSYVVFCVRLWAVDFIYEPLFRSMSRRYDLWTVNFFYVPLFSSMCHRRFLWTIILSLCAIVTFYVPSHSSMCRQRYPRLFLSFLCPHPSIQRLSPYNCVKENIKKGPN